MTRVFLNSPMLPDREAVERYAHDLGALAIRGYTAIDGSHRALLEITPDAAGDEIADEAKRIERRAKLLRARAEEWCQTQPARAGEAIGGEVESLDPRASKTPQNASHTRKERHESRILLSRSKLSAAMPAMRGAVGARDMGVSIVPNRRPGQRAREVRRTTPGSG